MAKRSRKHRNQQNRQASPASSRWLILGVVVIIGGLLAFGTMQVLGGNNSQTASASAIEVETGGLQSTSLDDRRDAQPIETAPAAVIDRETKYLGTASDPATVSLAEAGQLDQPTLLWFHADWCHVCQQVKPEVIDLGEAYEGQVKIVRLNVDHAESGEALRRYGVRATPTFVLFDVDGQLRGNVPGWPGYQAFTSAFDQLLQGG